SSHFLFISCSTKSAIAITCGWLLASQIIKKSATASFTFLRSREIMFSPFFSCIALMMVLMSFEFFVNRTELFFFRVANTDNCSNNLFLRLDVFVARSGFLVAGYRVFYQKQATN